MALRCEKMFKFTHREYYDIENTHKEMQIKTRLRYHFLLIRLAKIKKQDYTFCCRDYGKIGILKLVSPF